MGIRGWENDDVDCPGKALKTRILKTKGRLLDSLKKSRWRILNREEHRGYLEGIILLS